MKKLKVLLVAVIVIIMSVALFTVFTACESDDPCMTKDYTTTVNSIQNKVIGSTNNQSKVSQTVIQSPLSEDIFITGDATVNGGLNTNGYDIIVEGDLVVNGPLNGDSNSNIGVRGVFDLFGSMNMNGMNIYCDTAIVFGSLNGPGYIYYCSQKDFTGSKNNNNPNNQNIFQQSTHCGVLNVEDKELKEPIPCDYLGKTVNGITYNSTKS